MQHLLGDVVAAAGKRQLRMAETEKYPHVTYFFNGGVETPNIHEDRAMAQSPKVATYDLQPEMSAVPLTDDVIKHLDTGTYDLLILNYANPDMVGHTGVLEADDQGGRDGRRVPPARGGKGARARRRLHHHRRPRQLRTRDQRRRHAQHRAHNESRPVHLRRPERRQGRNAGRHPRRRRAPRCFTCSIFPNRPR